MRNVVILGAGRSGTSLVAGLLAGAGYFMGNHLNPANESNARGQFEDREINAINEDVLAFVTPGRPSLPGSWFFRHRPVRWQRWLARIPLSAAFSVTPDIMERMARFVRHEPYCFKDPRFSYTLPAWRPFLREDTLFVCVFRHPSATAQSMLGQARRAPHLRGFSITFDRAVEVWTLMYRHILEIHRHRGEWLFLHYHQVMEDDGVQRLASLTGASLDPSFPDISLRHLVPGRAVTQEAAAVYRQLCELSGLVDEER